MKAFISYSSVDRDVALRLSETLKELGIAFFLDQKDIPVGVDIAHTSSNGIADCTDLIVVLSPASLQSQWVPFEIGQATALAKRVLPFLTHPSLTPPAFLQRFRHATRLEELKEHFRTCAEQRNHDEAKFLLSKLVIGYKQRIQSAPNEEARRKERLAFSSQFQSSAMQKEMPDEVFELWLDQCLSKGEYLTILEFIQSTQDDKFFNSVSTSAGQRYAEWLLSKLK